MLELADIVTTVSLQLPHSREQQEEADRIGLELMARAGFNPRASTSLWRKMGCVGGRTVPCFYAHKHPAPPDSTTAAS